MATDKLAEIVFRMLAAVPSADARVRELAETWKDYSLSLRQDVVEHRRILRLLHAETAMLGISSEQDRFEREILCASAVLSLTKEHPFEGEAGRKVDIESLATELGIDL